MSEKIYSVSESRDAICRIDLEVEGLSWRGRAIVARQLLVTTWKLMHPGNSGVRLQVFTRSVGAREMRA